MNDSVESSTLASQGYLEADLGRSKVDATKANDTEAARLALNELGELRKAVEAGYQVHVAAKGTGV